MDPPIPPNITCLEHFILPLPPYQLGQFTESLGFESLSVQQILQMCEKVVV